MGSVYSKTVFSATSRHYEYMVVPYEVVCLINDVLEDIAGKYVIAYLDNIFIYFQFFKSQIAHVKEVPWKNQLFIKVKKYKFHVPAISFTGCIISSEHIKMDYSKVKAVTEWSFPHIVKVPF